MKRPITRMEQMLATASKGVSSTRSGADSVAGWASLGVFGVGVFFFVILRLFVEIRNSVRTSSHSKPR
jgi:hypothetical protein